MGCSRITPPITRAQGFTLIELSIVLVIIGLVIGGILVGNDLIKAAQVRGTVTQMERFKTAAQVFRDKYQCIPGDCPDATAFGLPASTSTVLGDRSIDGELIYKEPLNFWQNLSAVGLIEGHYDGYTIVMTSDPRPGFEFPATKINPKAGFWISGSYDETIGQPNFIWIMGNLMDVENFKGALSPYENYAIDSKIDDGIPNTGTVQISYSSVSDDVLPSPDDTAGYYGAGGASANVCADNTTTPYQYNVLNTSLNVNTLCILRVHAGF